jgi:hypothetical protein
MSISNFFILFCCVQNYFKMVGFAESRGQSHMISCSWSEVNTAMASGHTTIFLCLLHCSLNGLSEVLNNVARWTYFRHNNANEEWQKRGQELCFFFKYLITPKQHTYSTLRNYQTKKSLNPLHTKVYYQWIALRTFFVVNSSVDGGSKPLDQTVYHFYHTTFNIIYWFWSTCFW